MKKRIQYCLGICLFILSLTGYPSRSMAQSKTNPYYIDGNDVVFVFDIRAYGNALKGKDAARVDFADLKIYDVAISGDFNNWSQDGWKMSKKGDFQYELRKPLISFNDPFPIDFKYIINGKYIADPDGTNSNSRQFANDFLEDVYRVDLSVLRVNPKGNVLFKLDGRKDATEVILTGSFNGWDEKAIKMHKGEDGWTLRADLPPGRYEYKFIVDGQWTHDPKAKENNGNEHGTLNSVLYVTTPVDFTLEGFPNAKNVILTGSFVDWNEKKIKMIFVDGVWRSTLQLPGGKHLYKFIIDGQWHTDPSNPIVEDDGYGNLNSVLFVN